MPRILIVDDDPQGLYMLESLLKGHGYQVVTAVNGEEALNEARRSRPDLIVSDFFMPTMDGFALCRECKKDEQLKAVPFIAYTATYTDPKDEELALSLGAARFLIKPVEPAVLLREIEQILADSKAGRLVQQPSDPVCNEQYLRDYNEALIRKLEKKVAQFHATNRALHAEIARREQVEAARQAAHERLADIIEFLPDATFVIDQNKRVIAWNRACEAMTGVKAADMLGQGDYAYSVPFFGERRPLLIDLLDMPLPKVEAEYKYVKRAGDIVFAEIFISRLRGGRGAHLWGSATSLFDREGKRSGAIEVIRDITEQKLIEQALRESEAQFRAIFELAAIGIAQADPITGQWLRVNAKMCAITGYSADEMLCMHIHDITHPEDKAPELAAFQRVVRGETSAYRMEKRYIRKDGDLAWVNANVTAIRDAAGNPVRSIATIEDITERKQIEDAIRRSEERYRTLVEASTDYIYTVPIVDGRMGGTIHSPGCMGVTGYSPQEYQADGQLWLRMIPPEDQQSVLEQAQKLESGRKVDPLEHRIIHKNGGVRWVRNTTVLRFDSKGNFTGYEGLVQDVTEQKKLLEQLLQSQKMEAIGLLAGGIAHDFRNQLTVIKGYGEMLDRQEMVKGEDALDCVRQILKAVARSAELSGQLLAFSRQQELRPMVVNLDNVIAGLSKSLSRMVGEDVRLSVVPCGTLGNVKIDAGQFQQTLVNLVVNARDAMPQGGQLAIETRNVDLDENAAKQLSDILPGPYVVTSVSDTGVGMDKMTLKHIFEPFFTTKPVGQGTGLGLSMVYGFVRQSGGHVTVYSEPGQGSTFNIYLPRVREALPADVPVEYETALPRGTGTILIVEDEKAIRQLVAHTLHECGYTVLEAFDAKNAMSIWEKHGGKIDLLISDVVMPGMSGPEIAAKLLAARPGLPVLYTSGYTGTALANRGILPSDVNLLVKPFSSYELADAVLRLMSGKNAAVSKHAADQS